MSLLFLPLAFCGVLADKVGLRRDGAEASVDAGDGIREGASGDEERSR